MLLVILACALLISTTTVMHYEALRGLSRGLPALRIPNRSKLLVVIFTAFVVHALEIGVYGVSLFVLIDKLGAGTLTGRLGFSFMNCLYFSAETYTSLGFGDLVPVGPVRLLAGTETLNGLLMIGWSASYTYIAMERFWREDSPP